MFVCFFIRKNILKIQVSLFLRKDFICIFIALLRENKLGRHINKKRKFTPPRFGFFVFIKEKKNLRENGTGWVPRKWCLNSMLVFSATSCDLGGDRLDVKHTFPMADQLWTLSWGKKKPLDVVATAVTDEIIFICKINLSWSAKTNPPLCCCLRLNRFTSARPSRDNSNWRTSPWQLCQPLKPSVAPPLPAATSVHKSESFCSDDGYDLCASMSL